MPFEYSPLEIISRQEATVRIQKISKKIWWNCVMNLLASSVERYALGVDSAKIEVEEIRYRCPVEHKFSRNKVHTATHYKASDGAAVVVLPQRGIGYNFAQLVCCYLATNGISSYELQSPLRKDNLPEGAENVCDVKYDLQSLKEVVQSAVAEARGLIDIVNEDRIGILGISLGAIFSSVVYGVDDRVTSACLVMGGGNFTALLRDSQDKFVKYLRTCLGEISEEDIKDIEPCNFAAPHKAGNLLMVNAIHDKSVPDNSREALWEVWGRPEQYLLGDGHFSIIRRVPSLLPTVLEHYQRTLCRLKD